MGEAESFEMQALESLRNWGAWQLAIGSPAELLDIGVQPVFRRIVSGYRETNLIRRYNPDEAEITEQIICMLESQRNSKYLVYYFCFELSVTDIVDMERKSTGVGRIKAQQFLSKAVGGYVALYKALYRDFDQLTTLKTSIDSLR